MADHDLDRLAQGRPSTGNTHLHRQQYLYGFVPIAEVLDHVRTHATPADIERLPQIVDAWEAIRPDIETLLSAEEGVGETIQIDDLPREHAEHAERLVSDGLLQRGLQRANTVALVEIDKLVAAQRTVHLDYVDEIAAGLPDEISLDFLIDFCLSPRRAGAPIQHLEIGRNAHVFSSPNADLRFLGSFLRHLGPEDLDHAESGGIPVVAVVSYIGYGDMPINVLWSGSRAVLNNGFHRVCALRRRGVRHIPVILQQATDTAHEFPAHLVDLPRDYLLGHPRPVLMKDFLEEKFNIVLHLKNRLKTVTFRADIHHQYVPY